MCRQLPNHWASNNPCVSAVGCHRSPYLSIIHEILIWDILISNNKMLYFSLLAPLAFSTPTPPSFPLPPHVLFSPHSLSSLYNPFLSKNRLFSDSRPQLLTITWKKKLTHFVTPITPSGLVNKKCNSQQCKALSPPLLFLPHSFPPSVLAVSVLFWCSQSLYSMFSFQSPMECKYSNWLFMAPGVWASTSGFYKFESRHWGLCVCTMRVKVGVKVKDVMVRFEVKEGPEDVQNALMIVYKCVVSVHYTSVHVQLYQSALFS